jgi:predicted P-loop ATPase
MIRKWLVGIIEGVYTANCNQLMLVLAGEKNTGKSWFFENLLPKDLSRYFVNGMITNDKDTLLSLCSNLIFFNDEFTNKEADSNVMKQILSAKQYDIRAPYGKKSVKRKKLASLCAATNETQVLNDPTGNRRIVVFEVVGRFNFELYNAIDKGRLFAHALALFNSGVRSQLTYQEIDELEAITSGKYSETSMEEELLMEFMANDIYGTFKTTTGIKDYLETWSKQKLSVKKLGMELKRLGFERVVSGKTYGYNVRFLKNVVG